MASETNDANFARIMCAEVAQAVRERAYPGATIETIAATIAARIAAARREGAEAMRGRYAEEAMYHFDPGCGCDACDTCESTAKRIRALPLPGEAT